ncbi:hypothetical protein IQ288_34920 [Burkholderia sp. R-69980]|nr:hypothetical protein [Burkholderia sp. R-69980]
MSEPTTGKPDPNANPDSDYSKEFWSISNATTGFAIAQNIVFYVAVGPHKGDLFDAVGTGLGLYVAAALTVFATVAYVGVVLWCHRIQRSLAEPRGLSPGLNVTLGRWKRMQVSVIVVLHAFALLLLFAPAMCQTGAFGIKSCVTEATKCVCSNHVSSQ